MKTKGVPVLMYHALEDERHPAGAKDQGEQLYIVSVDNFRKQMQYLHTNGFKTYLIDELLGMESWPQKAVVLTFDDGHESNYTLALPILQEFGFKAEFFITTGWIGTKYFLKPEQIVKLHKAGMGIGSHSVTHAYLNDLSASMIHTELIGSKNTLSQIIEQNIDGFSAPGGRLCQPTVETARKCDYKFLCTSTPEALHKKYMAFTIPRFAMRQNTTLNEFHSIINLSTQTLYKIKAKAYLLSNAKKILGNKLYEKMREIFM